MSIQEKVESLTTHGPLPSSPERFGAWSPPSPSGPGATVADVLRPLVHVMLGIRPPVRIEFWDGSGLGPEGGPGSVLVGSPDALRSLLWAPGELGLARAFIAGDLDFRGDIIAVLRALRDGAPRQRSLRVPLIRALGAAQRVGAVGLPLARPVEEVSPRGLRHSRHRDAQAIRHHYDISNDFYRLVLGGTMTYSCAFFAQEGESLESAQVAKHDLVCRKLGLDQRAGMRLLDVGCGWGAMAIHAARAYGADVVGVTLSEAQAQMARRRVSDAGLEASVEIRVQDYRDLAGERFDAVSSVGMFEHVGRSKMATYFESLHELLAPTGRLLNHAISSIGGSRLRGRSFIGRYVFPDGELLDVGDVVLAMEEAGFEVRDVESLREHYVKTLRSWVANLHANWDQAVELVGVRRARVWLLYMAASANGFDDGGISIHQVLGVRPGGRGQSGMPATRNSWSRGAL
jgi:cyclopropane-fatty-acyl-phospholipid synthase